MTLRARQLPDVPSQISSHFRIRPGQPCDLTFKISDHGNAVDWSGQPPRFRIFSQRVDQDVVLEITDPAKCSFGPDGIWQLHLSADETVAMPVGGMCYTLEHQDATGEYVLGVHGGISCSNEKPRPMNRIAPARGPWKSNQLQSAR